MKRTYHVSCEVRATLELDDSVVKRIKDNVGDANFQEEISRLAYEMLRNRERLTSVDGYTDLKPRSAVISSETWIDTGIERDK